jgi:hypothetical protein
VIEPMLHGRPCLIVGSAPGVRVPAASAGVSQVVIGANAGAAVAQRQGRRVQLLATTSHLFRTAGASRSELHTRRRLKGMRFDVTWVDEKNGRWSHQSSGIEPGRIRRVSQRLRSHIVKTACGRELWVSTGVFAACLAVASGASSVELVGVSLMNGHHGMANDSDPRFHVAEDAACLRALSDSVHLPEDLRRAVA